MSRVGDCSGAEFDRRDYRLYQAAVFVTIVGLQILSLAVGWMIYDLTKKPLYLGYAGLVQFLPSLGLFLIAGSAADRFDHRKIMISTHALMVVGATILFGVAQSRTTAIGPVFVVLFLVGVVRAFDAPATAALLPALVPGEYFSQAVAWTSSIKQVANVMGPALGGLAYAVWARGGLAYLTCALMSFIAMALILSIRPRRRPVSIQRSPQERWATLLAGVRYVYSHRIILSAMSLDLFAVLFGGAVALLPVFARDLLHVDPRGLGILRATPAVGSFLTAVLIGYRPLGGRLGLKLLGCVFVYGIATCVMAVSHDFNLTLLALFIIGSSNIVSVIIRQTLIQIQTPAPMRGRVSAVSQVFNVTSNQLGDFESGVTASWWGTVPAVVFGGLATCACAVIWGWRFSSLRHLDRFQSLEEEHNERSSAPTALAHGSPA